MKNRVLRSALAVILVIAMVLTMAACDTSSDVVEPTTTPATATPATETPVAPTEAPEVTTAPTVAPTTSVEKDEVADTFGIVMETVDGTYGTKAYVGEDTFKDYILDEISASTGDVYAYSMLDISKSLIMDEDYSIEVRVDGVLVYDGYDSGLVYAESTTDGVSNSYSKTITVDVTDFYDGDSDDTVNVTMYFVDEDEIYVAYSIAGDYEIEFEITIVDAAANYGAWDIEDGDADEWETEMILTASLEKQQKTISIDPFVVVESDGELQVGTAGTRGSSTSANTLDNTKIDTIVTFEELIDLTYGSDETALSGYGLYYEIDYTKEAAIGTYAVEVYIVKDGDTDYEEVDLDDINELLINTEIVAIDTTEIYVISEYDWNELRDVVTSIGEIDFSNGLVENTDAGEWSYTDGVVAYVADGYDDYDYVADGFYGDDMNLDTQLVLALARYNALSAAQQAFFEGGMIADLGAYIETENVEAWLNNEEDANITAIIADITEAVEYADELTSVYVSNNLVRGVNGKSLTSATDGGNEASDLYVIDYIVSNYDGVNAGDLTNATLITGTGAENYGLYNAGATSTILTYEFSDADDVKEIAALIYSNEKLTSTYAFSGEEYLDYLEDAEDAAEDKFILDAFKDVVDDSDMADYFDTVDDDTYAYIVYSDYMTSNSSAITAYNTVDTYWNSLSEDDQEVIEESTLDDYIEAYKTYTAAVSSFDAAEVDSVVELITGAYSAYSKAIVNGAKIVYQDGTDWAYINSTEVKTLTAEAYSAYSALTSDQKELLDVTEYTYDGGETTDEGAVTAAALAKVQMMNIYEGSDGYYTATALASGSTDALISTIYATAAYDDGADLEIEEILDALVAMNDDVDTMLQVINYVNIEDYSTETLVYGRLNQLVYGTTGMNFPSSRYAMDDIINAPDRLVADVVAEYQAWIDYILDLEDYKADVADAFEAGVAEYFADNADDYSSSTISFATTDDYLYEAIITAIMNEGVYSDDEVSASIVSDVNTAGYFATKYASAADYNDAIKTIIATSFLTTYDIEDFESAYDAFEEFCDVDDLVDLYVESFKTSD